ncbi:hypothetical protein BHE74_00032956 [Ensete ventricosum]|nr:hypothetical protein BHE74_00032956 [Ensete ventricosum]
MVACKVSCCSFDYIHSLIWCRLAPTLDPLLSIKFYERTKEQQASLGFLVEPSPEEEPERQVDRDALAEENNVNVVQKEPHGSVGALAGRRAIAQGKAEDVAAALCRYSAPEEVNFACCLIVAAFNCFPQSDMASVKVPELDLELASGTLGGIVTTVEGLITKISESKFHFLTF